MDSLITRYREAIAKVFQDYADYLGNDEYSEIELVFDRDRDRYLFVETGWQNGSRIYGTLLHIDIIDGKLWIQHDGTEDGIANELVAAGIPKNCIVLAFYPLEERKHAEFAVS
ncbi:MAG: XisI protein [Cyanobacteria bacterium P01_E01_bin.42]